MKQFCYTELYDAELHLKQIQIQCKNLCLLTEIEDTVFFAKQNKIYPKLKYFKRRKCNKNLKQKLKVILYPLPFVDSF